eukprot:COSAG02_NODE_1789_length_10924_cov_4.791224_7_plen_48_part_00
MGALFALYQQPVLVVGIDLVHARARAPRAGTWIMVPTSLLYVDSMLH